jgi:hypothetical protein
MVDGALLKLVFQVEFHCLRFIERAFDDVEFVDCIARNLLLGLRPLREPVARPEGGEKGVAGEKGAGRSEKRRVSSDQ